MWTCRFNLEITEKCFSLNLVKYASHSLTINAFFPSGLTILYLDFLKLFLLFVYCILSCKNGFSKSCLCRVLTVVDIV